MLRLLALLLFVAITAVAILQLRRSNARARAREQRRERKAQQDQAWREMIARHDRGHDQAHGASPPLEASGAPPATPGRPGT